MDNLTAHKGERERGLIEERGCELLYLPPILARPQSDRRSLRQDQGVLRKAEARTREALVEAMGTAISAVSAHDGRGFFEHCGYHPPGQLLCPTL